MEFPGPCSPLVRGLLPLLESYKAQTLMDHFKKFKTSEITEAGFHRAMKHIAGDQKIQTVTRQLESQGSSENALDQSGLQSEVPYQLQNLPTPSAEMQENLIFLQPMQFAHVPIPTHETVLDNLDSQSTANSFDQSALQSQVLMQLQNLSTPPHGGVQLVQLDQEREPPTFPNPSLNKLQPHMQFADVLIPTYESAGGIQHQPEKLGGSIRNAENAPNQSALQSQVPYQLQNLQIPSAEKHENLIFLQHMQFAHVPIPTHETVLEILDSRSTANAFDQSALQSQVSMQQQNLSTPPPVFPEREPPAFPTASLNKLQPHMQFVHRLIPKSAGGIQHQLHKQLSSNLPTATSSKTPARKPKVGKKKSLTLDDCVSSPSPSRKKQKVSGTFSEQTIEQINDVTSVSGINLRLSSNMPTATSSKTPAKKPKVGKKKSMTRKKQNVSGQSIEQINDVTSVSGINLREEEEQMFSGPKRDSVVSKASQRIVQEKEDNLILEKIPLQQKLKKIVSNCGLKGYSNDVERCLSLRLDVEKLTHGTFVTSDIGHQIMLLNRKAQDKWKTKQAEREKLQKYNKLECSVRAEGEKEKDDSDGKAAKMRLTVANVAARSSFGGGVDIVSKWQLMAEIPKQKHGGTDSGSSPQPRSIGRKMNTPEGGTEKWGRSQGFVAKPLTISVKDVISALEREPQMSKSTLIYRLYEKNPR